MGQGLHAVHVLNGPTLPKSFESQPQLTALFIQFSFSENALALTYSNVETRNFSGGYNTPGPPRKGREVRGREVRRREGNLVPPLSNQSYAPDWSQSLTMHELCERSERILNKMNAIVHYVTLRPYIVQTTNRQV